MPLRLHFLNVGHGDCTFVELPSGRLMMVDINNSKSLPGQDVAALAENKGISISLFKSAGWEDYYQSLLTDPVGYYYANFKDQSIFRYVQTHPDMDHMSGLHRFFWQEKIPLINFWDVAHTKEIDDVSWSTSPYAKLDWLTYRDLRNGRGPDDNHKVINNTQGATGNYWSDDDVGVLSPTTELIAACNATGSGFNNVSQVLKITYGGRTVILPGDAEDAAWSSILNGLGAKALDCDILKASHHGRDSGFHATAYQAMDPDVVVCSVGKKPSTDASADYAANGARVLSTRFNGTVTATIWGDGEVWIDNTKGERVVTLNPLLAA